MKKLKARLPCSACGALGHWKDDKECPKNKKNTQGVAFDKRVGLIT